jgi:hypothetical protein
MRRTGPPTPFLGSGVAALPIYSLSIFLNSIAEVGFTSAWDIGGKARSVLRGGYGMYFDQSFLNVPLFAVQQASPEIYATFVNDGDNLAIDSPPPAIPRPLTNPLSGARGRMIDPDFQSPFTQQWNMGYAQELGNNVARSLSMAPRATELSQSPQARSHKIREITASLWNSGGRL